MTIMFQTISRPKPDVSVLWVDRSLRAGYDTGCAV